ncbi:TusE/DsrC/DsvC family sulfur relay protein [Pseudomonas matsuisoli]|uniref:Sulfurtransferase n=1 Tax=Pseudomonas matsuisoli TaxID=1515666 RepID=A0A917UTP2_9PSED|nr:TusE/DsrC/DsvC family sulfur relay protein [Pseudomonas matsuisoli]GGJ84507.1 sulfurtransferase [Pseudomonas matsuisoli]
MSNLNVQGQAIPVDADGYLLDINDWSEGVAASLAEREGISLSPAHWDVLQVLRAFYDEYQLSPSTRPLVKYAALKLGADKGNSAHLNRLFNGAPAKLGAKLAGLPKPANCI